jgi:protein-disulfide isomerase
VKTPVVLLLLAVAFGGGYFFGESRGRAAGVAIAERFDKIDTQLEELAKRPAAAAQPARAERPSLPPAEALKIIKVTGAPVRGRADAPITIVEYGDFQCPFCKRSRPTLKKILEEYPQQVRIFYKHFPLSFHREAMNAHKASLAAGEQGKFWEMHDLIFDSPADLSPETMRKHAQQLGLDMAKFDADYKSDAIMAKITADQEEGKKALVRGTPAFFVNGKMISGAQPFEAFKKEIDALLAEKKKG